MTISPRFLLAFVAAPVLHAQAPSQSDSLVTYRVTPASTDSAIHRFNEVHYVVFERRVKATAPLLVFLPGTNGRPENTTEFANVAAHQGYRVIGLMYNDVPAVAQICPRNPDAKCSDKFRHKRIYGDDVTGVIDDRREESIVNRLSKVLMALHREHPDDAWDDYLEKGQPKWTRIAVSGLSQGAGMAAFIAQKTRVARVILFSSPWDNYGPRKTLAPWVTSGSGATPSDRWFAVYHQKEPTAETIVRAYSALRVPKANIRVFSLEPRTNPAAAAAEPPYHPSVVGNGPTPRRPDGIPAYIDEWRFLLGDMR